tara:strand:- start:131 stop:370 length:240 start_codon:yes stop_codon:yes gene_type:complete
MRALIGLLCMIIAIVGGTYIALYWGIIQPIITIAAAIDTNTATAGLIGTEVIKFFIKEFVALAWVYFFIFIALFFKKTK